TISVSSTTSCPTWCTSCRTDESSAPGARNSRSSSRREGTAGSRRRLPLEPLREADMAHALDSYAAERDRIARLLNAADGVARLPDEVCRQFVTMAFPPAQQGEWRFTSVSPIADGGFVLAEPPESPVLSMDID